MIKMLRIVLLLAASLPWAAGLRADHWDEQSINDDSAATTPNELVHGSDQLHDLRTDTTGGDGAQDRDWYRIRQEARSSYEVVVDATSGDIAPGPSALQRTDANGVPVQQAQSIGSFIDMSLSLRWENAQGNPNVGDRILVMPGPAGCPTPCDEDDVYRIRVRETTYAIPRFNNAGTQVTVLLLQNPTDYAISANVYFWDAAGTQLHVEPVTLAAKNVLVLNTASITAVNGQSGAITITHNGRFGDLSGKTVALEPASGFSFDSPMIAR